MYRATYLLLDAASPLKLLLLLYFLPEYASMIPSEDQQRCFFLFITPKFHIQVAQIRTRLPTQLIQVYLNIKAPSF